MKMRSSLGPRISGGYRIPSQPKLALDPQKIAQAMADAAWLDKVTGH